MKKFAPLLLLCAGGALTGCSAISSRVVGDRYFCGVRTDYVMCFGRGTVDPDSRVHPALAVVDMPFSLVGDVLFLPYDAARGSSEVKTNSLASAPSLDPFTLLPGDTIEVNYSALGPDGPPLLLTVDAQGVVHLPMDVGTVSVQGLSLEESAAVITAAYVPRFFSSGQVRVSRVQPAASGNSRRVEHLHGS